MSSSPSIKKPVWRTLSFQLVVAVALGSAIGTMWPVIGVALNPLAIAFVKLVKMLAAVLVALTIMTGFSQMRIRGRVWRLAATSFLYFELVSTLGLVIGMIIANIFTPGAGLSIPSDGTQTVAKFTETGQTISIVDFLLNVIPKTVIDALASGSILQVILVSMLFGYALCTLGERAKAVTDVLHVWKDAAFVVVELVIKCAPIGVFGAAAFTLGRFGVTSMLPLIKLIGLVYLGCAVFSMAVFGAVAYLTKFNLLRFIRFIKEEMIVAFTTTSSEAALPGLMQKLEAAGCCKGIVGFVVPTGYSFNLDGSSIYLALAASFIAQAAGLNLSATDQMSLLLVLLVTSKGIATISGGAFVALAASLTMFPDIPLAGLALILGMDRLMDAIRTTTNVVGNGVATMAIAYWLDLREPRAGYRL